ncbi:MAG TPA: efflux RND transporter periplasmic adaptor subunit [Methylophilaceae bacterium]
MAQNWCQAAQPLGCLFEPDRIAEIGSPVVGIVDSVNVDRGSVVRKGQVLATLHAEVERATVNVANTRSKAEADVKTAEANLKLAKITEKRGEDLLGKKYISQQAYDKSVAETSIAQQKLVLAQEQLDVWGSELTLARAQLGQRYIHSPIDGIVAERYIWPGERVEEKPLFKVAKIDPLRVEMVVPVALYGLLSKDMILTVTPELPNAKPLKAKVVLVDKLIDGASNTFRLRAEIPNKDLSVPSGVRCKAELPDPPVAAAANPAELIMRSPPGDLKLSPQGQSSKSSAADTPRREPIK